MMPSAPVQKPDSTVDFLPHTRAAILLTLAGLCAIAYLPAINNGFISDDYVILERVRVWGSDFSYIFQLTPDRFRITSYLAFGLLKWCFGYHAAAFYVFAILLHFLNSVLVWKFLGLMTGLPRVAVVGSIMFAVGQSPQEAIMWLAGMNEALLALFLLATLLLWIRKEFLWSSLACLAALFSKESGIVILLFLPLTLIGAIPRLFRQRQILYIAVPSLIFSVVFLLSIPGNPLVEQGLYAPGARCLLVWLKSVHRLLFPWFYLALLLWFTARRGRWPAGAASGLAWMTAAFIPYILLTYQDHVPSRHTYLASIGFAWALALLAEETRYPKLRTAFLAAFIVVNLGYLWTVKDRQYQQRAAPTARLIEQLRNHRPGPTLVDGFPLNPWIAKMTAKVVTGWNAEMIQINEPAANCAGCLKLRWDPKAETYAAF
jgi:hypothetical protein